MNRFENGAKKTYGGKEKKNDKLKINNHIPFKIKSKIKN